MVAPLILFLSGSILTLFSLLLLKPRLPKQQNFTKKTVPTSAGLFFMPIILTTLVLGVGGVFEGEDEGSYYLIYVLVAGIVGFADDFWGGSGARGFRGHLGALSRGNVTTGFVKMSVLGVGAVVLGVVLYGFTVLALVAGFLMAGSVNLANLLDLRPGRALKFLAVPILVLLFLAPGTAVLEVIGICWGCCRAILFLISKGVSCLVMRARRSTVRFLGISS